MIMNKEVNIEVCVILIFIAVVWKVLDHDNLIVTSLRSIYIVYFVVILIRIKLRRLIMIIMVVQDLRRDRVQLGGNLLRRSWQASPSTSLHLHHDHHLRHHHQLHRGHDQHHNIRHDIYFTVAMFSQ